MKEEYSWTEKGTLYSEVYEDIFFKDGSGIEESEYVFLQGNNIQERIASENLVIGELGFGTGLNFLLTWKAWQQQGRKNGRRVTFVSCEKHPLTIPVLEKAHSNFPELKDFSKQLREKWPLTNNGFHLLEFEEGNVALLLLLGDAVESLKQFEGKVDAWYLDGFAPAKNPEMWSEELFKQMAWHSKKGTTLATFTAAGFVRRGLKEVGFSVERIKGFGFKRHMTVGRYEGFVKDSLHLEPWYRQDIPQIDGPVAVVGAGMAGLNLAYYLQRAGFEVTVYDSEDSIAAKASGNKRGMLYPLISKKVDRLGMLTEIGAHFTWNQIQNLGVECREGILEFLTEDKKINRIDEAVKRYNSDYLEVVTRNEISEKYKALYHKRGLSLSPLEYAEKLSAGLNVETGTKIVKFEESKTGWEVYFRGGHTEEFSALFVTSAFESTDFEQLSYLPLRKSRGQVVYLPKEAVKSNVSDLNYINYLTEADDCFVLGASFNVDDDEEELRQDDTQKLLDSVKHYFPNAITDAPSAVDLTGRVCFRTVLKDYFPVVGGIPDLDDFTEKYSDLKHGKPISKYEAGKFHQNLFTSCGHGSRGFAFSPLSAAYLARLLADKIHILPATHIQAVHPARFLIKEFRK